MATALPKNQSLVLSALQKSAGPRTAYELLDTLRDAGFRAPLTVYRALDGLQTKGLVHRIEGMKAFVACSEHDHDHHTKPGFAVCDDCGAVSEIEDAGLEALIGKLAARAGFAVDRSSVELFGRCSQCREPEAGA